MQFFCLLNIYKNQTSSVCLPEYLMQTFNDSLKRAQLTQQHASRSIINVIKLEKNNSKRLNCAPSEDSYQPTMRINGLTKKST